MPYRMVLAFFVCWNNPCFGWSFTYQKQIKLTYGLIFVFLLLQLNEKNSQGRYHVGLQCLHLSQLPWSIQMFDVWCSKRNFYQVYFLSVIKCTFFNLAFISEFQGICFFSNVCHFMINSTKAVVIICLSLQEAPAERRVGGCSGGSGAATKTKENGQSRQRQETRWQKRI